MDVTAHALQSTFSASAPCCGNRWPMLAHIYRWSKNTRAAEIVSGRKTFEPRCKRARRRHRRRSPADWPLDGESFLHIAAIRSLAGRKLFIRRDDTGSVSARRRAVRSGSALGSRGVCSQEGHADLAYRDLVDLGLPANQVLELIRPPSAVAFADRFARLVESDDPVALFGFSYCLERMAVERDDAFMQVVRSICPPQTRALRFLKVHSIVGSDGAHVDEQLSFFDTMTHEELEAIVGAAFGTAVMLGQQPTMDQALTDLEICRRLACAGITLPEAGAVAWDTHIPSESTMA